MADTKQRDLRIVFGTYDSENGFIASTEDTDTVGSDKLQSVSVSRTIGNDGRLAVGVAEAAQCDVKVLTGTLPTDWRTRWFQVLCMDLDVYPRRPCSLFVRQDGGVMASFPLTLYCDCYDQYGDLYSDGLTYQWYQSSDGEEYTAISDATSSSYYKAKVTSSDISTLTFYCEVADSEGSVYNTNIMGIWELPTSARLTSTVASVFVIGHGSATFECDTKYVPSSGVSYQWQVIYNGLDWEDVESGTESAITVDFEDWNEAVAYRCTLSMSGQETAYSNAAYVIPIYTADGGYISLGVFRCDRSSITDDRLFTSFTAYDPLYWVEGNFDGTALYKSGGDVDINGLANKLATQLATAGLCMDSVTFGERCYTITNKTLYIFKPKGTLRDVLSFLCVALACNALCDGNGVLSPVCGPGSGGTKYVSRSEYGAGALTTSEEWKSTYVGVLMDFQASFTLSDGSTQEVDRCDMAYVDSSKKSDVADGYFTEIDGSSLVYNDMPMSDYVRSHIEELIGTDIDGIQIALSQMLADYGSVSFNATSNTVNGRLDIGLGDITVTEDPISTESSNATLLALSDDDSDDYVTWTCPVVSSEIAFNGDFTNAIGMDSADYESDSYTVYDDGTIERNDNAGSASYTASQAYSYAVPAYNTANSAYNIASSIHNWNMSYDETTGVLSITG